MRLTGGVDIHKGDIVRLADHRTARLLFFPKPNETKPAKVLLPSGAVLSVKPETLRVVR